MKGSFSWLLQSRYLLQGPMKNRTLSTTIGFMYQVCTSEMFT